MRAAKPLVTSRARELRKGQTKAERLLWSRLKNKGLNGFKFVRQGPVGCYFLDFACRERKLAVEVDGAMHTHASKFHFGSKKIGWFCAL